MSEHDALGTVQPPGPAAASRRGKFGKKETPPKYPDEDAWVELVEEVASLSRLIVNTTTPNDPSSIASGNTNSSGDLVLPVYQVADGMEYRVSRVVVEVSGYTPSAPYSGVGFCAVYALQSTDGQTVATATALGGLRDVAAGSATQAFMPTVFEYGDHQAPRVRGPFWLAVVVSAGPASKQVTAYHQGRLRRITGLQ